MSDMKSEEKSKMSKRKKILLKVTLAFVVLLIVWRVNAVINTEHAKFIDECSHEALLKRDGKPSSFCDDPAQSTNHKKMTHPQANLIRDKF